MPAASQMVVMAAFWPSCLWIRSRQVKVREYMKPASMTRLPK